MGVDAGGGAKCMMSPHTLTVLYRDVCIVVKDREPPLVVGDMSPSPSLDAFMWAVWVLYISSSFFVKFLL